MDEPLSNLDAKLRLTMRAQLKRIQRELETFHHAIVTNTDPVVTLQDGFEALKLAHRILKEIEARTIKSKI